MFFCFYPSYRNLLKRLWCTCAFLFGFPVRRTRYTPTATAATIYGRRGWRGRGRGSRQRGSAARRGARRWSARGPGASRHGRHVRPTPATTASGPPGPAEYGRRGGSSGRGRSRSAPPSPPAAAADRPPPAAAATATAPCVRHVPFGGRGRSGRHTAQPRVAGCRWRHHGQQSHERWCVGGRTRSSKTRQGFDLRVSVPLSAPICLPIDRRRVEYASRPELRVISVRLGEFSVFKKKKIFFSEFRKSP